MNSGIPKQFLLLSGLPVLMRSIRAFYLFDPTILIILALPESFQAYWQELCEKYNFKIQHQVITGGDSRFFSVRNSLDVVPDNYLVAIHDGVRPLVSQKTISRAFQEADTHGNAIPVIPVNESIRKVKGEKNEPVSRDMLRFVQTPQVFRAQAIKNAYANAVHNDFTDDASVLEMTGEKLYLVDGNPENIKITLPSDLVFAEAILLKASLSD
jgi:2-C-methyl-D-erythritol 4-phosphate cytidylyltransferase